MRQPRSLAGRIALLKKRQAGGEAGAVARPVLTPDVGNVNQAPAFAPDGTGAVGPGVNNQFGGVSPNIRTLTAIPPSQAKATAVPQAVANPNTLQTIVAPAAITRTLPNIVQNTPTVVLDVSPEIETSADVIIPEPTAEAEAEAELGAAVPTGAEYNMEEEAAGIAGAEGVEGTGLPGLGEKESEVILPDNNRGVAIGIAFGVFALLAVIMVAGFLFMRWRKKKDDSIFDRPPPPGIDRSQTMAVPPDTYINEKMPEQRQYASYANLERGNGGNGGGPRQSLNRWIQNTQSRFSTPTTEGGIVSMYSRQENPVPPPPSFLRPGGDNR